MRLATKGQKSWPRFCLNCLGYATSRARSFVLSGFLCVEMHWRTVLTRPWNAVAWMVYSLLSAPEAGVYTKPLSISESVLRSMEAMALQGCVVTYTPKQDPTGAAGQSLDTSPDSDSDVYSLNSEATVSSLNSEETSSGDEF